MPSPTRVLLWTDAPAPYVDAIAAAGLTERVVLEKLARKDTPTQAQRADTEALLAWGAPSGLLPHMPEAALGAGIDRRRGRLACAAGSASAAYPHLRARNASRVDAGKHPWRAVPSHQALCRNRRGSEAGTVDAPHGDAAQRQDARDSWPGRCRAGGGPTRRGSRHAGDRHATAWRSAVRTGGGF